MFGDQTPPPTAQKGFEAEIHFQEEEVWFLRISIGGGGGTEFLEIFGAISEPSKTRFKSGHKQRAESSIFFAKVRSSTPLLNRGKPIYFMVRRGY